MSVTITAHSNANVQGSIRGKVGIALGGIFPGWDRALVYATGGVAFGGFKPMCRKHRSAERWLSDAFFNGNRQINQNQVQVGFDYKFDLYGPTPVVAKY